MEECSTHLVQTFPDRLKNRSTDVFWRIPSPKTHTTRTSRHDRHRQLTLSVSFVEESIGGGRLTSNVTWTPTFRKLQLSRKGLSQCVQNHNQHRVTRIEPVFLTVQVTIRVKMQCNKKVFLPETGKTKPDVNYNCQGKGCLSVCRITINIEWPE